MKNKKAIVLLFIANAISGFAQGITMLAIPWYFTKVLSMESFFAVTYSIITFICLFWSLYAGVLVDKYSRKKIFLTLNLTSGLILTSISLIAYKIGEIPTELVVIVFALMFLNFNIHYPNLYAFCQELTEKKNYRRINSYLEIVSQTTTVMSAAIAAILIEGTTNNTVNLLGFNIQLPLTIEAWDLKKIFLLDGLTYFVAFIIISIIPYKLVVKKHIKNHSILKRMKDGFNFLLKNKFIFIFGACSYIMFAFLLAAIFVISPNYIETYLNKGADTFASSEVYYSIGALIAGFFVGKIFGKRNSVFGVIVLMLIASISFSLLSLTKNLPLFFSISVLIGFSNAGIRIFRITYLFNHVPNNIIGRVNSVFGTLNTFIRGFLILFLAIPFFGINDNIKWGYLIGGLLLLICAIPLILYYKKFPKEKIK